MWETNADGSLNRRRSRCSASGEIGFGGRWKGTSWRCGSRRGSLRSVAVQASQPRPRGTVPRTDSPSSGGAWQACAGGEALSPPSGSDVRAGRRRAGVGRGGVCLWAVGGRVPAEMRGTELGQPRMVGRQNIAPAPRDDDGQERLRTEPSSFHCSGQQSTNPPSLGVSALSSSPVVLALIPADNHSGPPRPIPYNSPSLLRLPPSPPRDAPVPPVLPCRLYAHHSFSFMPSCIRSRAPLPTSRLQ